MNPFDPLSYQNRGLIAIELKNLAKAERNLNRAMQIFSQQDNVPAYQALRRILLQAQRQLA